jgi:NAD(P)H-dependent flavin oxidoreductase YrpB (nitropropane dioxygenase family)
VLAAQAAGADLAYVGSQFIATDEANAPKEYKQAIVDSGAADIVYTDLFTGFTATTCGRRLPVPDSIRTISPGCTRAR